MSFLGNVSKTFEYMIEIACVILFIIVTFYGYIGILSTIAYLLNYIFGGIIAAILVVLLFLTTYIYGAYITGKIVNLILKKLK